MPSTNSEAPVSSRSPSSVVAFLLLLLTSPIIAVVSIAVRLTMGSPVLFRQQRSGKDGNPFEMIKFRTMRPPSYPDEPDEARLGRLGAFLRKLSLDELPTLWNVFRGDLGFVGPRPLLPEYDALYTPEQRRRLEVRPGLTGWAQIKGRNSLAWEEKFALDVWYVDHRSLWLDLRIVLLTIPSVLRSNAVSHPGHATMPKFTGQD